eukprot:1378649-Amphidinium_carterae.1
MTQEQLEKALVYYDKLKPTCLALSAWSNPVYLSTSTPHSAHCGFEEWTKKQAAPHLHEWLCLAGSSCVPC